MRRVMLTYDGEDIREIDADQAETIVYQVQAEVDAEARRTGLPYGMVVSTRRIEGIKQSG